MVLVNVEEEVEDIIAKHQDLEKLLVSAPLSIAVCGKLFVQ